MFIGYYINTNYVLWLIPVDTTLKDTSILKVLLWIVKTTQYKTAWTGSERVYQFTHILACCAPIRVARERIANKTRVSLDKRRGGGLHRLNRLNRLNQLNRARHVWVSMRGEEDCIHRTVLFLVDAARPFSLMGVGRVCRVAGWQSDCWQIATLERAIEMAATASKGSSGSGQQCLPQTARPQLNISKNTKRI